MRLLQKLLDPILFLIRLIVWPIRARSRKKVLEEHGWLELHLEGQIVEIRRPPRLPSIVQRILRREEPMKVVLSRLRRFADEVIEDPHAKGVLVRLGMLGGGWAKAAEVRALLQRIRDAKREVVVHVISHAGNMELMVASVATKLLMPPTGMMAAAGAAVPGLFLEKPLERIGVTVEVAGVGRFKSAPDRFTRTERSEFDRIQTQALIDEVDEALVDAVSAGRVVPREKAIEILDAAPLVGREAKQRGYCDGVARDEDIGAFIQETEESDEAPVFIGAGTYLELRQLPRLFSSRKKHVGVVEVHGAIVDAAPGFAQFPEGLAVDRVIVDDLRGALEDPSIHAVVLHVDSRGGSVTASDAIYSAVKRLDREKPVIACMSDVAASGGYYVACGARNIVASPLTITGSIGVFAMLPTWPKLARMLEVGHDFIKNRAHADLYDPWRGLAPEDKAHYLKSVESMYDAFIELVAEARGMTKEEVHAVAEGRVWSGKAARTQRLVDGLGGMEEAIDRAKDAAGGRFERDPILIRARSHRLRPPPFAEKDVADALLSLVPDPLSRTLLRELVFMARSPRPTIYGWSPIAVR